MNCEKQQEIKWKSIKKTVTLAGHKLNGLESKISEALINSETSHGRLYCNNWWRKLKERIRMVNSQRSEKKNVTKVGKKSIVEVIKHNEV